MSTADGDASFVEELRARAASCRRTVVLPEVTDPRTVAARDRIAELDLADVVWIEDPRQHDQFDAVCGHLLERRRAKGLTAEQAERTAAHPLWFGAGLVALGHADASVAGAAHTTADVLRAGLQCVGTRADTPIVSSMFLMVRDDAVLSYADCGVVPDPDVAELVAIAATTAANHRLLTEDEPRVAFLSFSTNGSAEHDRVTKVRAAAERFAAQHPAIPSGGELQFDAAYVPAVARRKAPNSALASRGANVFVFPDLDAGNIAYKITERLGNFRAFGPLVQGLAKPCLDLSRGCAADDIVDVVAIASLMARADRAASE